MIEKILSVIGVFMGSIHFSASLLSVYSDGPRDKCLTVTDECTVSRSPGCLTRSRISQISQISKNLSLEILINLC